MKGFPAQDEWKATGFAVNGVAGRGLGVRPHPNPPPEGEGIYWGLGDVLQFAWGLGDLIFWGCWYGCR